MMTRTKGKRDAPDDDTFYEDTTPTPNPKRLKVEKQERKDKLPAKSVGYHIKEATILENLTHDEKVAEIKLIVENIKLEKLKLNNLYKAYRTVREVLYPGLDDSIYD